MKHTAHEMVGELVTEGTEGALHKNLVNHGRFWFSFGFFPLILPLTLFPEGSFPGFAILLIKFTYEC